MYRKVYMCKKLRNLISCETQAFNFRNVYSRKWVSKYPWQLRRHGRGMALCSDVTPYSMVYVLYQLSSENRDRSIKLLGVTAEKSCLQCNYWFLFPWRDSPSGHRPPDLWISEITLRHTTLGRVPLDEWSARSTDTYLKTHNSHKTQTSMPPAGFEPAIPTSELPQTHVLDRAATGMCSINL
jgi:hypothetical protein